VCVCARMCLHACSLLIVSPKEKKSNGVRSGDLRVHTVGPPLPVHFPGKQLFRNWSHYSENGIVHYLVERRICYHDLLQVVA
jgi:hypothetical protein